MSGSGENGSAPAQKEVPDGWTVIEEGMARVIYDESEKVFYNKVQVMNRDTSIQCIKAYIEVLKEERRNNSVKMKGKLQRRRAHLLKELSERRKGGDAPAGSEAADEIAAFEKRLAKCDADIGENADGNFPGIRVLEALSATGLRSIRYAQEIPEIKTILANDILPKAYQSIARNIEFNNLDPKRVIASNADAAALMFNSRKPEDQFDVIDLDPYGAPTLFLDAAVQAVKSGGMLLVTCTDMADLCGNTPETAWAKYGSTAMKSKFCKEVALRTILSSLASHAARYGRFIEPLVSLSLDFYIRVAVRVKESRSGVKQMPTKLSMVYKGCGCQTFYLQPIARQAKTNPNKINPALGVITTQKQLDQFFGTAYQIAGPIWSAPMHDLTFVNRVLTHVTGLKGDAKKQVNTWTRIHGVFTAISEELPDVPLYYPIAAMANTLHCLNPKLRSVKAALVNLGYRVSCAHCDPCAVKTDAPPEVMWDIFRCWIKENPVNEKRMIKGGICTKLLQTEPEITAVWEASEEKLPHRTQARRTTQT